MNQKKRIESARNKSGKINQTNQGKDVLVSWLTSEQGPGGHEKVNPGAPCKKAQGRASAKAFKEELLLNV